jgi:hypothetical protein
MGPHAQTSEKAIVNTPDLGRDRWRGPQQKATERGRVGVARQPGQILKDAVLPQQLGGLDALQSEDHRVQQGEQHLADGVAVVPLDPAHLAGHGIAKANPRHEARHEVDAAIVRPGPRTESDREVSRSPWHGSQSYRNGSVRSRAPQTLSAAHNAP